MIKLAHLLPKQVLLTEGSAVPGALEGWLDPDGTCHYVPDTHSEWVARLLKQKPADETDVNAYEGQRMRLMRLLYDKGWARIVIKHDDNLLYFDTYDTPWTTTTIAQRKWLINAAIHGVKVVGEKVDVGGPEDIRNPPYKIQFGNDGEEIPLEKLGAR